MPQELGAALVLGLNEFSIDAGAATPLDRDGTEWGLLSWLELEQVTGLTELTCTSAAIYALCAIDRGGTEAT